MTETNKTDAFRVAYETAKVTTGYVAPVVKYAILTETTEFYDRTANEGQGKYATVEELKARMAEGKFVTKRQTFGKVVDSLEDIKVLKRAAELNSYGYNDPSFLGVDYAETGTIIQTRKAVMITEV